VVLCIVDATDNIPNDNGVCVFAIIKLDRTSGKINGY
jgi:hypothetical protein